MGEVWRARDTRLEREVALKVLPQAFTDDPDRLARFQREARALAALNHPNVAQIYELETEGERTALVMELVEGPTLASRLETGPLPVDECLKIARQVALALEEAHAKGIVHRDLKPANVMITPGGQAKVLDFGLAKALEPSEGELPSTSALANSPTLTAGTHHGMILGTAAYMSPEQARGEPIDERADVWAFGVLLFEMLSGRRLFGGNTVADVLADVLRAEIDLEKLPPETPPALRRLLRLCLRRMPESRLHHIADARIAIDDILDGVEDGDARGGPDAPAVAARRLPWIVAAASTALALGLVALLLRPGPEASFAPVRFRVEPPEATRLRSGGEAAAPVVVSPDGRHLVFGVVEPGGKNRLWWRALDSDQVRPLPGTEGGSRPFWSPDSRSIGFFADRRLLTLELSSGVAIPRAEVDGLGRGGAWGPDGTIVYAPGATTGLMGVPAAGGAPAPLTTLDEAAGEGSHRYPTLIGDRAVAFLVIGAAAAAGVGAEAENRLDVIALDSNRRSHLLTGAANAEYSAGELFFYRGGALLAQSLDAASLTLTGVPRVVRSEVMYDTGYSRAVFSVSQTTLAYQTGRYGGETRLVWLDRQGHALGMVGDPAMQFGPAISPDGSRVAWAVQEEGTSQLWLHELPRGAAPQPFGAGQYVVGAPRWSPDGRHLAFGILAGRWAEPWIGSVDEGTSERLFPAENGHWIPADWSRDGRYLLLSHDHSEIWAYDFEGTDAGPFRIEGVESTFGLSPARLSPDNRWLAFSSDVNGASEIFVTSFPDGRGRWLVSKHGFEPVWSADGRSLFFRTRGNEVNAAEIHVTGGRLQVGAVTTLFHADFGRHHLPKLDVSDDGERFLALTVEEDDLRASISVEAASPSHSSSLFR
jgi:eukaryotic-like serine/threonine-protein kinase